MAILKKRKARVEKKPAARMSKAATKTVNETGFGGEPDIEADLTDENDYRLALNRYSRFMEPSEVIEAACIAMKDMGYNPKQIAAARRSGLLVFTIGGISTMLNRKCIISDDHKNWLKNKLDNAVKIGSAIKEAVEANTEIVPVNVPLRTENRAKEIVADIESIYIDRGFIEAKYDIENFAPVFEIFNDLGVKPAHTKVIQTHFECMRADLADNVEADCVGLSKSEAVRRKRVYAAYIAIYEKLIGGAKAWSGAAADKKPRVVSEKVKAKQALKSAKKKIAAISSLKFKPNDEETGLASVKPAAILGSAILYTFNTRYNILTKYVVQPGQELSVKGTTILNYDEKLSESKRAGRARASIKQLSTATKSGASKIFSGIKGTTVTLRGRTSEETILIGAFK